MRNVVVPLLTMMSAGSLLMMSACSSDPNVGFTMKAVLDAETDGVRLHDGGLTANAAMAEQICIFDTLDAEVIGDIDLAGTETLLDAHNDLALARSDGQLHTVPASVQGDPLQSIAIDAIDGRLLDEGLVAVVRHEGVCAAMYDLPDQRLSYAIPGTQCAGDVDLAVDRATGTLWIADGATLTQLELNGDFVRHDGAMAGLVSFDASTGGVVVGERGGKWVQGVDRAGDVTWTRSLKGTLHDLSSVGDAGMDAIMVRETDGRGLLTLLDSADGEPGAVHPLPEVAELTFSNSGRDLALVLPDRVYIYDVDPDVRLWTTPASSRAEAVDPWVGPASASGAASTVLGVATAIVLIVD
jgi:hypothetical protein